MKKTLLLTALLLTALLLTLSLASASAMADAKIQNGFTYIIILNTTITQINQINMGSDLLLRKM